MNVSEYLLAVKKRIFAEKKKIQMSGYRTKRIFKLQKKNHKTLKAN